MLNAVLNEINNYFLKCGQYSYSKSITFTSNNTMTADFTDTFIASEYVLIEGSRLNDGVYLIAGVNDTTITIDTDEDITISTESEVTCTITKCYIPKALIGLVVKIAEYNSTIVTGIKSEKQGARSVTYGSTSEDSATGWDIAFRSQLNTYRKLGW